MPESLTADQLEELLRSEIPCKCGRRPAVLRSTGHGCRIRPGPFYACLPCWKKWYQRRIEHLQKWKRLSCKDCDGLFYSVETFGDYRPF